MVQQQRPLPVIGVWLLSTLVTVAVAAASALVPQFNPISALTTAACMALVLVVGLTATVLCWRWRGRGTIAAHVAVAATALCTGGTMAASLAKTPLGLMALVSDGTFRTAMMQRYSMTFLPVDVAYEGHSSFYPPLWFWLGGRAAALVGQPGWEAMKWSQIVTAFLVPVIGFAFWRRVVAAPVAAVIAIVGALAMPLTIKGDEWLAITVMLPWWLTAFADVHAEGVRRWPAWLHGIIAGLLLSLQTAFFPAAAVASVVVFVLHLRRGDWRPVLRRWLVVVAVGLLVWSPIWVHTAYEALTGPPARYFQLKWFGAAASVPPPITLTPAGVLGIVGLAALVWYAPRHPVLRPIALFGVGIVLIMVIGITATATDHPMLVQRSYELLRHTLIAAGVLGVWTTWRRVRDLPAVGPYRNRVARLVFAGAVAFALTFAFSYVHDAVRNPRLEDAYNQRLPDGTVSSYAPNPRAPKVAVNDIAAVVEAKTDQRTPVVLSTRYDLMAYRGYWNFQMFNSLYAQSRSEWMARRDLIKELGRTTDPVVFHRLVTQNRFQRIDAIVLDGPGGGGPRLAYRELAFPYGTKSASVQFDQRAWADQTLFDVTVLPDTVIIVPR